MFCEHADARDICKCLAVGFGDLLASSDGIIDMLKVAKTIGRTDFVHLAVDTRSNNRSFTSKTEVLEIVDAFLGSCIMANQSATFDRIVGFCSMEA